MLSKNELKYYSSLLMKKFRKEEGKFIVEGKKLVLEALSSGFECEIIAVSNAFMEAETEFLENPLFSDLRREIIKQKEIEKLSDTKSPQGIIGVFNHKAINKAFDSSGIKVALENISDPGNLGTIIRNCDWFGISDIILNQDCTEVFNPKVIRASAGSVFHPNIFELENFYDSISALKAQGYKILCADLSGENINDFKINYKIVVVFANEANGPSERILRLADSKITIPGKGKAESLNVASASSIILHQLIG